jgi:hypothetical protein
MHRHFCECFIVCYLCFWSYVLRDDILSSSLDCPFDQINNPSKEVVNFWSRYDLSVKSGLKDQVINFMAYCLMMLFMIFCHSVPLMFS